MDTDARAVARRRFLARAAGASAAALVIPTIVTVTPAAAAGLTSPPPEPPPEVQPTDVAPAGQQQAQVKAASTGQLPFTGADVEKPLLGGTAAIAGGSALVYWSTRNQAPTPVPVEGDAPPVTELPE